jgi:hypothetical protein
MVINLLMTIFLRPFKAVQGFSLDIASTTVLHITILAGIILTGKLDPNISIYEQPTLVAVTVVAVVANFAVILVLFGYVVYDNLNGKEFKGVPLILYFRYYSPRIREEIRQLQNSHANFIASLESKNYNKLSFNRFIAVTAKEGNAFRRAYHKKQSIAQALREKELADMSSNYDPNIVLDEEVGRLASSSSSELTVTPPHSSPASVIDSGSTSGSVSTESSEADLSDSDDSQHDPAWTANNAMLPIPKFTLSSSKIVDTSITTTAPSESPPEPPSQVQKQPGSAVALGSWHSAKRAQDADVKAAISTVPNSRDASSSSSRVGTSGSVSTAPAVARSFVASVSPTTPRVFAANENPTLTPVAQPLVPSVSPPTSLERLSSNKLPVASVDSTRVSAALAANRAVNVGSSPRQAAFAADVLPLARRPPQISETRAVPTAASTFSSAAVPPTRSASRGPYRHLIPEAPLVASPRHLPPPPPFPVDVVTPRDLPPPPFPPDFLAQQDMPPPLPRDARKQLQSNRSSAVSSVKDGSPPPPPVRQSPPPFLPPQGRRSSSQPASAFQRDEPPPLPPVSRAPRNR